MLRLLHLLLLLLLLPPPGSPEPPGLATLSPGAPPQAPDLLYADGVRAYSAGAWAPAVALLREALRSREELGRARRECGARCAAEAALPDAPGPDPPPGPAAGAWERLLLRAALRRAECLSQCAARRLGPGGAARLRVGGALRDAFRRREPYNYLQRAYYQVGGRGARGRGLGQTHPTAPSCPRAPGGGALRARGSGGAAGGGLRDLDLRVVLPHRPLHPLRGSPRGRGARSGWEAMEGGGRGLASPRVCDLRGVSAAPSRGRGGEAGRSGRASLPGGRRELGAGGSFGRSEERGRAGAVRTDVWGCGECVWGCGAGGGVRGVDTAQLLGPSL